MGVSQKLERQVENLIHAAGNVPYRVKKAIVGTSFLEDFTHQRKKLTHHTQQTLKGINQDLENMFEDVTKHVRHFEKEWFKHPERLQNRARRFISEGIGFLETTAEYLQAESSKLSKNLKHKIKEAINVVKNAVQAVVKYFSNLLEKFTLSEPILHAKQSVTKKASTTSTKETTHPSKHQFVPGRRPSHK